MNPYLYTCIHMHHVYRHTNLNSPTHVHICTQIHECAHIYTHMYIHAIIPMHTIILTHICTHTYMHCHMHLHTYTPAHLHSHTECKLVHPHFPNTYICSFLVAGSVWQSLWVLGLHPWMLTFLTQGLLLMWFRQMPLHPLARKVVFVPDTEVQWWRHRQ